MKPATQANACRASTSELPARMRRTSSGLAARVTPANCRRLGSGTEIVATAHTARSSNTAIAAAPATHGASTRSGARFHAASVERVERMPWTSTRSPLSIAPVVGPSGRSWSPSARVQAHLRHAPDRLERDPPRHLRAPDLAVAEDDRDLAHAEAAAYGAVGQLDLERVALRADAAEVDRLEHLAPVALEASGEVVHLQPEHPLGVPAAPAGDDAPPDAPALDFAAVHIARAEHDVGVVSRAQQAREVGRVVGEVSVHLADERGAGIQGPAEAGQIGLPEPELRVAVKHVDLAGELGGQAISDCAGAVGRGVVDDQHPMAVGRGHPYDVERGAHHRL